MDVITLPASWSILKHLSAFKPSQTASGYTQTIVLGSSCFSLKNGTDTILRRKYIQGSAVKAKHKKFDIGKIKKYGVILSKTVIVV